MRYHFGIMGFVLISACFGCGATNDGPEKYTVTGVVQFEGIPVQEGQIIFRPTGGSGHSSAGSIEDGKFSFESTVGSKQVEITAYESDDSGKTTSGPVPEVKSTAKVAFIPAKYNTKTTLSAEVEVDGENKFDFDLEQ